MKMDKDVLLIKIKELTLDFCRQQPCSKCELDHPNVCMVISIQNELNKERVL